MSIPAAIEAPDLTEWVVDQQACESATHGQDPSVHDGHATHYARINCPKCGYAAVKAYCQPFADYIHGDGLIQCTCNRNFDASQLITAIIPIAI